MSRFEEITTLIRERIPESIVDARRDIDIDVLVVEVPRLIEVLRLLRDESGFEMLSDLSATDWLPREPRYDVNYHLFSLTRGDRIRVKVRLADAEHPRLPSACEVWPGAEWHEREVYDFFGVLFDGHPNLTRILMPDEWIGHPLRKDYAVGGVPVEYKIEPAYVGDRVVSEESRPSAGGIPARLDRDRGQRSVWTWTGSPASGVEIRRRKAPDPEPPEGETE